MWLSIIYRKYFTTWAAAFHYAARLRGVIFVSTCDSRYREYSTRWAVAFHYAARFFQKIIFWGLEVIRCTYRAVRGGVVFSLSLSLRTSPLSFFVCRWYANRIVWKRRKTVNVVISMIRLFFEVKMRINAGHTLSVWRRWSFRLFEVQGFNYTEDVKKRKENAHDF